MADTIDDVMPDYQPGTITLPRESVSHWSTAMYGNAPVGHIHPYITPEGKVQLGLNTPGGKAPEGIHGGARRIDIELTPAQAKKLGGILLGLGLKANGETK